MQRIEKGTQFLSNLPESVKVVVFLGNSDSYVKQCQALLRKMFSDSFERINDMAVRADRRTWVHVAHPSGLNGHFNTWLNSDSGPGKKTDPSSASSWCDLRLGAGTKARVHVPSHSVIWLIVIELHRRALLSPLFLAGSPISSCP